MLRTANKPAVSRWVLFALALSGVAAGVAVYVIFFNRPTSSQARAKPPIEYQPRPHIDTSGFPTVLNHFEPWEPNASLEVVAEKWRRLGYRLIEGIDRYLANPDFPDRERVIFLAMKASLLNYEGQPSQSYKILEEIRALVEKYDDLAAEFRYSVIFFQGICCLRHGEDENCVLCRGESACILPIAAAAVHTRPDGSRKAIHHFTEYLNQFPNDLGVRWLLNVAYMTLGEYPDKVDPKYLVSPTALAPSEHDIGKFRDVGALVGVNRFNQAGGGIMDDFDNDGLLDIVVSSMDPTQAMAFFHNKGDGTFEDRTIGSGLERQLGGGLYCVQADYNNDGHVDIFVPRGAWLRTPVRPSLLRNNGKGAFTDVTQEAGMLTPVNSITAAWADFDNDGLLDLFVCCERQPHLLYRNKGNGTFEEVAAKAGVQGKPEIGKGSAWIDYDNDGYPDLFVNYLEGSAQLFHNNHDGTFTDVTEKMGIRGPKNGFSCWAWDYDNDGYLDIFATSYDRSVEAVVQGLIGQPHSKQTCKLYRNLQGKGFQDVTKEAGLDKVYATMGSNFGDFDNDGFLDMYLGTGDPNLEMLVPNRMFRNLEGKRFVEITGSSGTGHLQKGHSVACGDWDRDGNIDIFIEMGGATSGDRYHNVLFQNPGHDNNWLTVKLIGKKTNRSALGARIKVVTAGAHPLTVHRHISSGSSFGANPLQQTIGLGKADRIVQLEISWPTSGTTQVFRDVPLNQAIEVTELASDYRKLDWKRLPAPK